MAFFKNEGEGQGKGKKKVHNNLDCADEKSMRIPLGRCHFPMSPVQPTHRVIEGVGRQNGNILRDK